MSLSLYALRAAGRVYEVRAGDLTTAAASVAREVGIAAYRITVQGRVATLRDEYGNTLLDVEALRARPISGWVLMDSEPHIALTSETRELAEDTSARLLSALHGGRQATFHREGDVTVFTAPAPARLILVEPA